MSDGSFYGRHKAGVRQSKEPKTKRAERSWGEVDDKSSNNGSVAVGRRRFRTSPDPRAK